MFIGMTSKSAPASSIEFTLTFVAWREIMQESFPFVSENIVSFKAS